MKRSDFQRGQEVIAKVAIMGAKRGCGWRYAAYRFDPAFKSGFKFLHATTGGMYPNAANSQYSREYEAKIKQAGVVVFWGRPRIEE